MTETQTKIHSWLVLRLCFLGLDSWATAAEISSPGGPVYRMTAGGAKRTLDQLVRLGLAEVRRTVMRTNGDAVFEYRAAIRFVPRGTREGSKMNTDETNIETRVRALSTEELFLRYHQLVDKRLLDRGPVFHRAL